MKIAISYHCLLITFHQMNKSVRPRAPCAKMVSYVLQERSYLICEWLKFMRSPYRYDLSLYRFLKSSECTRLPQKKRKNLRVWWFPVNHSQSSHPECDNSPYVDPMFNLFYLVKTIQHVTNPSMTKFFFFV